MKTLHLVTQGDQPIGSTRNCCERCGMAVFRMGAEHDGFVDNEPEFTKERAGEIGYTRCTDETEQDNCWDWVD